MLQGELLSDIIEAVSNTYGNEFLNRLTEKLSSVIGADSVFIALFDKSKYESKTVSLCLHGKIVNNIEYSLDGTPCANVLETTICYYPNQVQKLFPNDHLLAEMNIEGYIGSPLYNSKKENIGLIVGLYEKEITEKDQILTLFQIFSGRIAAELERLDYERKLEVSNQELELQVKERTSKLEQTLRELSERQNQLIESEKLASLGLLSAGIAHEINNPLNFITGGYYGLLEVVQSSGISQEKIKLYLDAIKVGVERTTKIVKGLNQYTRSGDSLDETISVEEMLENCLVILSHSLRDKIIVKKDFSEGDLFIRGNSGKIHQVFLNIFTNAIQSMEKNGGELSIITSTLDETISIHIEDTGTGIQKEHLSQIAIPFFTTKEPGKGVGLGLSIASKILKEHSGSLEVKSEWGLGTRITIHLPRWMGESM
ncbi:GHKL domain protein [Leptospira yanagawae serovar Saopaulo str. Sao Paulo = ATCC 700523]|uniref:histidine kinase n=1 Tax=Leptospira yanagawae serovar Saopaulo str. Sao Paulo = ATCC 700523 TaxID=1249483 RepID=A0A5E8HDN6_9LEPT|nr:ATP-binding protein [Leptospira yanagawae]EOQ88126.1 GHKL domain protein [Leptospira yanagawae serovar Saopaulo str. Sao Paulo = ATCC 700523]